MLNGGKSKRNKGFTLVELVVVLVILALLAGILTPALLGYIDSSKREHELTNAKALLNAIESKLVSLYDQGLMPNVDFNDFGDMSPHSSGFSWKLDWTDDVMYTSGLSEKPFACGFACGQLCSERPGNYLGQGLSGLKKGYRVYVYFYMEKEDSKPVFYYNGEWTEELPPIPDSGQGFVTSMESEPVNLSSWYVPANCEGKEFNAAKTWNTVKEAAQR
ncbi:MAG: prepilin-type N-terminal cleavage/methylation domain-containing protein [Lachnospiraceae bacterium]|nr:prepilin-type N-terminal cleavage/methylation domain-containing protein [Lachnospiraceae bacterium]